MNNIEENLIHPHDYGIKYARIFALIGLIFGVIYSFGGLIIDYREENLGQGTALAFLALLIMPLMAAAAGYTLGLLIFWLNKSDKRGSNE